MNKREWVVIYAIEGKIRHDIVVADTLRQVADYSIVVTDKPMEECDIISIVENSGIGCSTLEMIKEKLNCGVVTVDASSNEANEGDIGFEYDTTANSKNKGLETAIDSLRREIEAVKTEKGTCTIELSVELNRGGISRVKKSSHFTNSY